MSAAVVARQWLSMATSATLDPLLTDAELDLILRMTARQDAAGFPPETRAAWAASTAYALGTELAPSTPNGHVYRVSVAGVSGASEPTWPTASGASVVSGTVTYVEAGAGWAGAWQLPAAAVLGWRVKAGKVAERYSLSTDGQSLSRSDFITHCNMMAAQYQRQVGGSTSVFPPTGMGADPFGVPNNWNPP